MEHRCCSSDINAPSMLLSAGANPDPNAISEDSEVYEADEASRKAQAAAGDN
jgi:hypothetical protein